MKEDKDERNFLAAVRKTLDASGDHLDATVCTRLTRARMQAVEQASARAPRRWFWLVAPLAASLVIVLVVAALFFKGGPGVTQPAGEAVADLEIITAAEAPDFYAELEFYQWLAEGEGHAG